MLLRSHLWADLTRSEIAEARARDALVVIPIGATEQHAEHLPVGTDTLAASTLSLKAAEACPHPVLVAPAISMAFSPHHASWPGTITLKLATLMAMIDDVTASIARAGFRRQLLVNGHGGNRGPLIAITTELVTSGREVGFVDYFAPPAARFKEILTGANRGVTHSGEAETALVMALEQDDPERLEFYRRKAAGLPRRSTPAFLASGEGNPIRQAGAWWPPVYHGGDCGYNGEPALATVEIGDRLAAAAIESLAAFYVEFMRVDLRAGVKPGDF